MPAGALLVVAKVLAAAFGRRLAERLASELVCAVAKGCPDKVDEIAHDAKARQEELKARRESSVDRRG